MARTKLHTVLRPGVSVDMLVAIGMDVLCTLRLVLIIGGVSALESFPRIPLLRRKP